MKMIKTIITPLLQFAKVPLLIVAAFAVIWILVCAVFFLHRYIKGERLQRGERKRPKKSGIIKQVFYEAPKMYIDDMFSRNPDFFRYQGLIIYTGRQGHGKTVAMVRNMMQMQEEYPLMKCITNVGYKYEDAQLMDWKQLIEYKNGIFGVVVGMDEIQNWFSSKQSKDFPPEMFEIITQNRKNRRVIMATTQNFYQPSKDIRAQCTEVHKCMTFLGVWTIVHAVRPILDSQGDVKEWKHIRWYSFAHTRKIRDSYDTYKVIESLMKSGFKERTEQSPTSVYVISEEKKNRKRK